MQHQDPLISRHCPECQAYWPLDHRFTACPVCDTATLSDRVTASPFATYEAAVEYARPARESRERHEAFERYYIEVHIPAGARKVEEAIKAAAHLTPAQLAAQFAMLYEPTGKESS